MKDDEFTFQMLYPPDGISAIVEVSNSRGEDFLHVTMDYNKKLIFHFFPEEPFDITEEQFNKILVFSKKNLSGTII